MALVNIVSSALAWLGRQGTRAVAISIFVGLALPQLAAIFKPFVTEQIFLLLCLAFLRIDSGALRAHAQRPRLIVLATLWSMVILPGVIGAVILAFGAPAHPDLLLSLVLQIAAPPIMSAPAFAALLGLDAALSLAFLIASVVLTPITAPIIVTLLIGPALQISPLDLGIKLFLLLSGAALIAAAIRKLAGVAWVERQSERIDGLNVIILFVFAVALMEEVSMRLFSQPLLILGLTALAFALSLGILAATMLVFRAADGARAFAIGMSAGHRNMGLMLAATAGIVPDLTWLYFALAQFPIYLLPQLLQPFARRLQAPRVRRLPNA
jgi:BASS family bile acid:Na+ symporter